MKLKLPELSAVAVPLDVPLKVSVVPLPDAAGVTEPEMVHVGTGVAVKVMLAGLAPLTITA